MDRVIKITNSMSRPITLVYNNDKREYAYYTQGGRNIGYVEVIRVKSQIEKGQWRVKK